MSTPNINSLNEGIVGQVANSLVNTANYISDTLQGNVSFCPECLCSIELMDARSDRLPKPRRRWARSRPRETFLGRIA